MSRLDVLICTYGREGLDRVASMNLREVSDVNYVVSCQSEPQTLPEALRRSYVKVVFTQSKGLSLNRNNAIMHSESEYALLCDDDVDIHSDNLKKIIDVFDRNPDVDIATFMVDFPGGKVYTPKKHDIWKPYKGYNICSVEIAFRVRSVKEKNLWFNPLWGIGAPKLGCGEELVFLQMARKAGLKGIFFPIVIGAHPSESTGERSDPAVLRAHGAYICLEYPATAIPRIFLKAYRMPSGFMRNIFYLIGGGVYGLKYRHKLMSSVPPES